MVLDVSGVDAGSISLPDLIANKREPADRRILSTPTRWRTAATSEQAVIVWMVGRPGIEPGTERL